MPFSALPPPATPVQGQVCQDAFVYEAQVQGFTQGASPLLPTGTFKNKHNPLVDLWMVFSGLVFCLFGGDFFALVRVNATPLVTFCDLLW